jgi:hypothetical protein
MALGRSLKGDGIVWLIVPNRSAAPAAVDAGHEEQAAACGTIASRLP